MEEEDRKQLYTSLLRGLANECQDRLCAQDKQHAWGPVRQFRVEHDYVPIGPVSFADVADQVFIVSSERTCLNCGKVKHV
jgi:hypothetical protein